MDEFEKLVTKPRLEGPKRHHYVSKFYLEGFADAGGGFHVYDRENGAIRPQVPIDTTVIGQFYTFLDSQDRRRYELEALFSITEGRARPAIEKLAKSEPLSFDDRQHLSLFIGMHAMRTPAAFEEARHVRAEVHRHELQLMVSSEEKAFEIMKEFLPPGTPEEQLKRSAADAFEMVSGGHFQVDVSDELARQMSLKLWAPVSEALYYRDWTVVVAPEGCAYVTSDSPVVLVPLEGTEDLPLGFSSLHAHVLFPLTRKLALVMNGDGGRFRRLTAKPEQVHNFNKSIAADCHRFVIGADEEPLRHLVEDLTLTGTRWTPRSDVSVCSDGAAIQIYGRGKRNDSK